MRKKESTGKFVALYPGNPRRVNQLVRVTWCTVALESMTNEILLVRQKQIATGEGAMRMLPPFRNVRIILDGSEPYLYILRETGMAI